VRRCLAIVALVGLVGLAAPAAARERLARTIDADQGLPTPGVIAIAQDGDGFLWLGTSGGLVRWDGAHAVRWGARDLRGRIERLAVTPDAIWAVETGGALHRADPRDPDAPAPAVAGPGGAPLDDVTHLRVDRNGLWVAAAVGLVHRDPGGRWEMIGRIEGDRVLRLGGLRDGTLVAATARAAYRRRGAAWVRWIELPYVIGVEQGDRGEVWIATDGSALYEATLDGDGAPRAVRRGQWATRGWDLAVRGDEAWLVMGGATATAMPGGIPELIGDGDRIPAADRVLVDREGSVWLGTQRGAIQLVEPSTATWTVRDGITFPVTRFVARTREGLWVASWGAGWSRIDDVSGDGGARGRTARSGDDVLVRNRMCVDGAGALWTGSGGAQHVRRDGAWTSFPLGDGDDGVSCLTLADGRVLLSSYAGLQLAEPGGAPRAVDGPAAVMHPNGQVGELLVDRRGQLWAASHDEVCAAALADVLGGGAHWRCEPVPGAGDIYALAETPSGRLWMGTAARGVLERDPRGAWRELAAAADLPSRTAHLLARARDGASVWMGGPGYLVRVREDGAVLEEIGEAQGLRDVGAGDLVEDDDGTLWIASDVGLHEIPARARHRTAPIAHVVLVDAQVDGRTPGTAPPWQLTEGHNDLALTYSALSYREPRRIRYRVRVDDDAWSSPSSAATVRLVDLAPGSHEIDVEASLGAAPSSGSAAPIEISVPRPLWQRPWTWALAALVLTLAIAAVQQARYRAQLRLVQQRVRIAMDLHDEIGSGLGSIHMMAGLADRVPPERRAELSTRVAQTAHRLGQSLTDIVSTLRAGSDRFEALIDYLAERGNALMPGDAPRFEVVPPDAWPAETMTLPALRAVQLIAVEALHNAARHAAATRVQLGARAQRRWRVWIEDDGVGIGGGAAPRAGGGHGLEAMRARG
jgi:signal transduction histidine kinase/ligand-binding sensor domain-containing protein